MMRNRLARSRRVVQAEHGQALILALIVMMIVSISAVSIIAVVTSTQTHSMRERQGASAFTGSEAGLDLAANAVVSSSWNGSSTLPPDLTVLQSGTGPSNDPSVVIEGGSVKWTATLCRRLGGFARDVEAGGKDRLSERQGDPPAAGHDGAVVVDAIPSRSRRSMAMGS